MKPLLYTLLLPLVVSCNQQNTKHQIDDEKSIINPKSLEKATDIIKSIVSYKTITHVHKTDEQILAKELSNATLGIFKREAKYVAGVSKGFINSKIVRGNVLLIIFGYTISNIISMNYPENNQFEKTYKIIDENGDYHEIKLINYVSGDNIELFKCVIDNNAEDSIKFIWNRPSAFDGKQRLTRDFPNNRGDKNLLILMKAIDLLQNELDKKLIKYTKDLQL